MVIKFIKPLWAWRLAHVRQLSTLVPKASRPLQTVASAAPSGSLSGLSEPLGIQKAKLDLIGRGLGI